MADTHNQQIADLVQQIYEVDLPTMFTTQPFFNLNTNLQMVVLLAFLENHEDDLCGSWDLGVYEQLKILWATIAERYENG